MIRPPPRSTLFPYTTLFRSEAVAHAEAELVRVRHLQVVVDQVDLAPDVRVGGDQRLEVLTLEECFIELQAARIRRRIARMPGDVEGELVTREGALRALERQVVEHVAVVGAARAAEQHEALVFREVVREADARLDRTVEWIAVVARADVLVDVDAAQRQRLRVGLPGQRACRSVHAVETGQHIRRRDVVEIRRRLLVVVAQADIDQQLIRDLPVVLEVDTVLTVLGCHIALRQAGNGRAELHDERYGQASGDIEEELRVERLLLEGIELDALVLEARLHGVRTVPLEGRERQVVLEAPALLSLVLEVLAAAEVEDDLTAGSRQPDAGLEGHGPWIERRILVRDVRVIEEAGAGELMAQVDTRLLVLLVAGERRGVLATDGRDFALLATLAGQLQQMIVGDRPVDLREVQVFLEGGAHDAQ